VGLVVGRDLVNQVSIVTGGTAGIGRATCLALALRRAHVVVVGRNADRIAETCQALRDIEGGGEALGISADVCREADMARMVSKTLDRFGRIDHLVAAAGILRASSAPGLTALARMSKAAWDEVLDVNLRGLYLSNRAVLEVMIEQRRGQIVNLSSTSGRRAYAFDSAYCASKCGAIGLTESLAEEARAFGVRVQVLLPGAIDTPMWDQNGPIHRPEFALAPARVADVVLFMLTLPADTILREPVVEPFGAPSRDGWRGGGY